MEQIDVGAAANDAQDAGVEEREKNGVVDVVFVDGEPTCLLRVGSGLHCDFRGDVDRIARDALGGPNEFVERGLGRNPRAGLAGSGAGAQRGLRRLR